MLPFILSFQGGVWNDGTVACDLLIDGPCAQAAAFPLYKVIPWLL